MSFSRFDSSNLSARMHQSLTHEKGRLLHSVAEEAARLGLPLYIVGGFVRDLMLGHPGLDFDLVVEGDAIKLAQKVAERDGGRVIVHTRFKTAQWFPLPATGIPEFIDFTSARSETYKHPAALPTVKPGKLRDDLRRRDFTINTLAVRLDGKHFGELRDDVGGLEDLQAGLIRVLHPGSFLDDPTRLFRLVRYEQRYGFRITPETKALIPDARALINHLSADRVRHEMDLIFEEEKAAFMLKRLAELKILVEVHPGLKWNQATHKRFVNGLAAAKSLKHPPSRHRLAWLLWLMDVSMKDQGSIDRRLHFEAGLRKLLLGASSLFADKNILATKKPSRCAAALDDIPLVAVEAVFLALPTSPARQMLEEYLETWRHVKPRTTGSDLKRRGLPPGPAYQSILQRLREAWLDGEVKTSDQEMALLTKLIK